MQDFLKNNLNLLFEEEKHFLTQKQVLLAKIAEAKSNQGSEDTDLILYNFFSELKYIIGQAEKIHMMQLELEHYQSSQCDLIGKHISCGNLVKLVTDSDERIYLITKKMQYVNPSIGIISEASPLAELILQKNYGDYVTTRFSDKEQHYQLMPVK
ncbi:MAG: hypothetical protein WCJ58_04760 [bacterium]